MPPSISPDQKNQTPSPRSHRGSAFNRLKAKATAIGSVAGLFVFLMGVGTFIGYYYSQSKKPVPKASTPSISNLTPDEINKLGQIGQGLGNSGQVLNIGADSLFRGKVDIASDLSVGGHFNANGPVTLSQLNISGTTALTGLNVGSNLNVQGTAVFQNGVNVSGLLNDNGNLSVSGSLSASSVNASAISVHNLTISGPLQIGHVISQGPNPIIVAGTAVGGGGTVSISGNDTAGTVNINTGNSPPAGVLATITFRAPYTATVHVLLSPLSGAGAAVPAYVTRTSGGFQIHTDSPPPGGSVLSYDYFVTQ
jgi:hypothetical protein